MSDTSRHNKAKSDQVPVSVCDGCGRTVCWLAGLICFDVDVVKGETTSLHTCNKEEKANSVFAVQGGAVNSNRRRH